MSLRFAFFHGATVGAATLRATLFVGLLLALGPWPVQAADRTETVRFAKGQSSAHLAGTVKGRDGVVYRVGASAGQTLKVTMTGSNASAYFNVGLAGAPSAMFVGSASGAEATLVLPTDGTYVVTVYLMRNAARRGESSRYTIDFGVTGAPLAPLPGARDAKIKGTPFHASAPVPCHAAGGRCDAFVVRRGTDATATVELRSTAGLVRRVLFVKGQAVAADTFDAVSATRSGDLSVVRVGSDERYEIPDALLTGG